MGISFALFVFLALLTGTLSHLVAKQCCSFTFARMQTVIVLFLLLVHGFFRRLPIFQMLRFLFRALFRVVGVKRRTSTEY
jgi:hypothetical protein